MKYRLRCQNLNMAKASQRMSEAISDASVAFGTVVSAPAYKQASLQMAVSRQQPCHILSQFLFRLSNYPVFYQMVFKKTLSLPLFTYGLQMLLMFPVCPVPNYSPDNLRKYSKCMLRSSDWMRSFLWLNNQLFHFHQFSCVLAPIPVEPYYVLPVSTGTDDNSGVVWNLSGNY